MSCFVFLHVPITSVHSNMTTSLYVGEETRKETEQIRGTWWRHLIAGASAGSVSRTCTAPLDRVKVFLQVHPNEQFHGISGCLTHMLREGGVQSLWRGNGINVLKVTPESALKFMAYDQMKRHIRGNKSRDLIMYERFIAGSFAGGFSQTVIYPLEVMKTRLALRTTGQFRSIWHAFSTIYRTEGARCFYRGYLPNLLGILPYAGIELAVYETLKKVFMKRRKEISTKPSVALVLLCGTTSCTCGQFLTYPFALVRTKLQAQAVVPAMSNVEATMVGVFRDTMKEEGIRGLYRGILPNLLKVVPTVSLSFLVYEKCFYLLCQDKKESKD